MQVQIRPATDADIQAIWAIMEPIVRAGETYAMPTDFSREEALKYWFASGHQVFVARLDGGIAGTYYLKANGKGGGSHVSNCGYMTGGISAAAGLPAQCAGILWSRLERVDFWRCSSILSSPQMLLRCICGTNTASQSLDGCPKPFCIRAWDTSRP